MTQQDSLTIINQIFTNIFNTENKLDLNAIQEKFAYDIKLPKEVHDSKTNEITWTDSKNSKLFITQTNMQEIDNNQGWIKERKTINSLEDIIKYWNEINYTTTERIIDSTNISKSDTIYRSDSVYQSTNCADCKNIIFSDSCYNCEYIIACSRSDTCNHCIKTDDSAYCTNSYNVLYSNKVSNSLFIQDCFNLDECIFCSHIANKKYCIANMQFNKEEYLLLKSSIIKWILNY